MCNTWDKYTSCVPSGMLGKSISLVCQALYLGQVPIRGLVNGGPGTSKSSPLWHFIRIDDLRFEGDVWMRYCTNCSA